MFCAVLWGNSDCEVSQLEERMKKVLGLECGLASRLARTSRKRLRGGAAIFRRAGTSSVAPTGELPAVGDDARADVMAGLPSGLRR